METDRWAIPTQWHVITGAPCAGKTAVIDALAARGYRVVHETARAFIDSQLAAGATLEIIKRDIHAFERHILLEKVRKEGALPPSETIFLDRAIPDSMAYYQLEGLNRSEAWIHSHAYRYRTIFLLARLDFELDDVRSEDPETAAQLERLLFQCYTKLGYTIVPVPVMPILQRTEFILANIT